MYITYELITYRSHGLTPYTPCRYLMDSTHQFSCPTTIMYLTCPYIEPELSAYLPTKYSNSLPESAISTMSSAWHACNAPHQTPDASTPSIPSLTHQLFPSSSQCFSLGNGSKSVLFLQLLPGAFFPLTCILLQD